MCGLLVNIVSNAEEVICRRVARVHRSVDTVLGVLNLIRCNVIIVCLLSGSYPWLNNQRIPTITIQVEVRNDVAKICQILRALARARRIRRTHICGKFAEDVGKGHLILDHLIVTLFLGDSAEILVRPSVGSYLMTFGDHTADHSRPRLRLVVNGTLVDVDTGNKERSLESFRGEFVENIVSVNIWAVVISDGHSSGLGADVYSLSAVGNRADLGARGVAGAAARWQGVGIACWAVWE
jgi:hypothetical protein